jgi:hypothetical protein
LERREPSQHSLLDPGKPRKTCVEVCLLKTILANFGSSPACPFLLLLSEHKHCDNVATNSNSENARSRLVASLRCKRGYWDKGRRVKYWARLGCWISPCYDPFSLTARFETYEHFVSLIIPNFFFVPRPTAFIESADMGFHL